MIYNIGGIKGGNGKSTTAVNLAVFLTMQGKDVLLIDTDDQSTATDWTRQRAETLSDAGLTSVQLTGKTIVQQVPKLKKKYDDVVIDSGGRDTTSQRAALVVSDIFIVPFIPRSFDIWTLDKVAQLVTEAQAINTKLKAYAFVNRADPSNRAKDNQDTAEIIKEYPPLELIDTPIQNKKSIANATGEGLSVFEYRPKDKKAIEQFTNLFNKILKQYHGN